MYQLFLHRSHKGSLRVVPSGIRLYLTYYSHLRERTQETLPPSSRKSLIRQTSQCQEEVERPAVKTAFARWFLELHPVIRQLAWGRLDGEEQTPSFYHLPATNVLRVSTFSTWLIWMNNGLGSENSILPWKVKKLYPISTSSPDQTPGGDRENRCILQYLTDSCLWRLTQSRRETSSGSTDDDLDGCVLLKTGARWANKSLWCDQQQTSGLGCEEWTRGCANTPVFFLFLT